MPLNVSDCSCVPEHENTRASPYMTVTYELTYMVAGNAVMYDGEPPSLVTLM